MRRVYILCEGQTEETFVKELLVEYFARMNIDLRPILLKTSKKGKGGVVSYEKFKTHVERLCKGDQGASVTTMIDLYGLPTSFPDYQPDVCPIKAVKNLESAIADDLNQSNFIPNVLVHEFEGLLFSGPEALSELYGENFASEVGAVANQFDSPEHINNSRQTAPSKRLESIKPDYQKPTDGPLIAIELTLPTIRKQCSHFNAWLEKLESLSPDA